MTDLTRREMLVLAPLAFLVLYYGVRPGAILDAFAPPTEQVVRTTQAAIGGAKAAQLPERRPAP